MTCRCESLTELSGEEAKQYADQHLARIEGRADGWEVLYRCRDTNARWLEDYPQRDEHAGGSVRLRRTVGWPKDAPVPHGARVREKSSGRTGTVAGFTQSRDGEWQWAVMMDDDERVWMVPHADTEQTD